jgi:NADP-dependent 3-hydroxy acid dehydrogenase YdfG
MAGDEQYGLGRALKARWPELRACSRKTGYDLSDPQTWNRVAEESLDYEVFLNCSSLWRFHQSLLAAKVWEIWDGKKKSGRMIHIGSTADTGVRAGAWMYPVEKSALKTLNRNLSYAAIGEGRILSTLISPGYLRTPKVEEKHPDRMKLDPEYIADVVEWVLKQPPEVQINEISLDPVQRRPQGLSREL